MQNCQNARVARQLQQLNMWSGMEKAEWLSLMMCISPMILPNVRLISRQESSPSEVFATPSLQMCSNQNAVYERACVVTDGSGWPPANDSGISSGNILNNLPEVENLPPLKYQLKMVLQETSQQHPATLHNNLLQILRGWSRLMLWPECQNMEDECNPS